MLSAGPRARRSPRSGISGTRRGVHRQGSWLSAGLGAVRRVVAAPLSWLGGSGSTATPNGGMDVGDDDEVEELDVQAGEDGKRRRLPGVEGAGRVMDGARDTKRRRMGGSEYDYSAGQRKLARQGGAYLDPPEDMFSGVRVHERARTTSGGSVFGGSNASFTFSAGGGRGPTMPSDPRASFTTSPPSSFVASSREQSIDSTADSGKEFPPKAATMVFPLSRQATARGSIRELSLPPATGFSSRTSSGTTAGSNTGVAGGQPYRMRTTPALGVQTVPRYQRATTPSFIGRPSEAPENNGRLSTQPTLGDILEQQRSATRSPTRQQSTMLIDNDAMQSWAEWEERRSATPVGSSNNERLLLGLDVFKTPLLPSRLKQNTDDLSQATGSMPDVLRQNKVDVPVGEQSRKRRKRREEGDDDADMPKLGLGKKREKKKVKESKPYGNSGGSTQKMLTKMRQEAEVQADDSSVIERDFAMKEDPAPVQEVKPATPAKKATPAPAAVVENEPATKNPFAFDDEPSSVFKVGGLDKAAASGRVGREKQSSNSHAPSAKLPPRGGGARFSGRPEDLGDDSMEMATTPPVASSSAFTLPKDFSFGPPVSGVFAQPTEASSSKQAPVSALPFSLGSKPMVLPTPPIIQVSPATPDTTPAPTNKSDGIPNFFSKSAATKTTAPEPPKLNSLFGAGVPSFGTSAPATPTPKAEEPKATPTSMFGQSKPAEAAMPAASPFSFAATPAAPSLVSSPFTLGASTPATTEASKPAAPLFGASAAAKADEAAKSSPFSFGAPATAPKAPDAAKSPFAFGTAASTPTPATEAPKAAFSFASASTTTTTPAAAAPEPPKTAFAFGAPTAAPATPAPEAPKPLFGDVAPKPLFGPGATTPAFSFGQPAASTSTTEVANDAAASTSRASTPAFQFGAPAAAPATPAPNEKKPAPAFTFATGAAPATPSTPAATNPFIFGAPATPAAPAAEAPKAFGFGSASTPAPRTPPKQEDNEISMDESPTRGPGMDLYGNAGKPTSSYFGNSSGAATVGSTLFGNNSATTNGASSSFGFGAPAPGSSTSGSGFNFGQKVGTPATNNSFSFGQQKTDAPATSGGFSFGQQKADAPASGGGFAFGNSSAPSSGGSFAFGNSSSSSSLRPPAAPPIQTSFSSGAEFTKASSPFAFGAGPTTAPPTAAPFNFGSAASNAGGSSAPGSPSTFASQPFAFGSPSVQPQNGFGFGSQPASPAVPTAGLPGSSGGGGFNFGTPPPSSHGAQGGFGSPAPQGGQPLFNIGSAPPPTTPGGSRQIKKMPARRGTGKR